nr:MAG TPA: hypothetical protein [Caudoviricetes sp.]
MRDSSMTILHKIYYGIRLLSLCRGVDFRCII